MGAPLDKYRRHGVAVLASGVVISLTALTAGLSPAVAQPDSDDVVTTTAAPEPEVSIPEPVEVPTAEPAAPAAPPSQVAPAPQPQAPVAPVVPEPEPAPQTQAPQTQAPQTQAPQTQAPARTSTAVETAEPATPTAEPSTTAERAPSTTAAPATSTATSAPATTSAAAEAEEPTASPESSARLAPATEGTSPEQTPASGTETSEARETEARESETDESESSASETSESAEAGSEQSETPTVSIEQAAKEIETLAPETLEAPEEDIELAKNAKPIFEPEVAPAPEEDVATFKQSVDLTLGLNGNEASASARAEIDAKRDRDFELVSNVRQWRPDWIEYDEYYRPVLMNPFRDPVRIVYVYDMRPRIVYIPPLARMVLEVAQFAAYSFTAAVLAPINAAIDFAQAATSIAVGSFFGGGYFPGVGMPLPPPPPPVLRYDNVPVLVNYSNARYEPFRVRQIVDVGQDPVYGGRKVLLDGATPAWGEWTQTAGGERQFEIRKTQQFPGLSEPAEGPLPGDYRLRLASDEATTGGLSGRDIFLMVAAGVIGTLGFGAIGLAFFLGRRRPEH